MSWPQSNTEAPVDCRFVHHKMFAAPKWSTIFTSPSDSWRDAVPHMHESMGCTSYSTTTPSGFCMSTKVVPTGTSVRQSHSAPLTTALVFTSKHAAIQISSVGESAIRTTCAVFRIAIDHRPSPFCSQRQTASRNYRNYTDRIHAACCPTDTSGMV